MIASDMFPRRFPLCLLLPNLSRACAPFYHALSKFTEFTEKPSHEGTRKKYISNTFTVAVVAWRKKEGCNTRTSQEVTHPSTTLAQARLTSEF